MRAARLHSIANGDAAKTTRATAAPSSPAWRRTSNHRRKPVRTNDASPVASKSHVLGDAGIDHERGCGLEERELERDFPRRAQDRQLRVQEVDAVLVVDPGRERGLCLAEVVAVEEGSAERREVDEDDDRKDEDRGPTADRAEPAAPCAGAGCGRPRGARVSGRCPG